MTKQVSDEETSYGKDVKSQSEKGNDGEAVVSRPEENEKIHHEEDWDNDTVVMSESECNGTDYDDEDGVMKPVENEKIHNEEDGDKSTAAAIFGNEIDGADENKI